MTVGTHPHDQMRAWATGDYTTEAATDLLIDAFRGRFATPTNPWIHSTQDSTWVDFTCIPDHLGAMSGGEQRLLRIAASLGCSEVLINLADNITGLDSTTQRLVLTAIAHSGG